MQGLFFFFEVWVDLPTGFPADKIFVLLELGLIFLAYGCIFGWTILSLAILARTLLKRRWYQFSLRTLLLVMLLVSLAMSCVAVRMERAKRQTERRERSRVARRIELVERLENLIASEKREIFESNSRCCLCFGLHNDDRVKEGQIVHIDGNRSNSKEDNLAFLCTKHHLLLDKKTSQHKALTHADVKHYRQKLYEHLKDERKKALERIEQLKAILERARRLPASKQ